MVSVNCDFEGIYNGVFCKLVTDQLHLCHPTNLTELPVIGSPNWFYLVLLSPYAGIYYWKSGDRVDDIKVKLSTNDDDTMNQITIEGNDEEIGKQKSKKIYFSFFVRRFWMLSPNPIFVCGTLDRFWQTLDLQEKGKIKVEGILNV